MEVITLGSRSFWLETSSRSSTSKAENDQGVKVASLRAFKVILSSRYPGARDHSEFLRLTTSSQRGPNAIPSFSLVPIKAGLNALWRELGHVNLMRMCNLSLLECSTVIPCGEWTVILNDALEKNLSYIFSYKAVHTYAEWRKMEARIYSPGADETCLCPTSLLSTSTSLSSLAGSCLLPSPTSIPFSFFPFCLNYLGNCAVCNFSCFFLGDLLRPYFVLVTH